MSTNNKTIEINMNADSKAVSLSQHIGSMDVTNTIPESITQLPDPLMDDFDKAMAWFAENEQAIQDFEFLEYTGPQMPNMQAFIDGEAATTTMGMSEMNAPGDGQSPYTYDTNTATHWMGNTADGETLFNKLSSLPLITDVDMQEGSWPDLFSDIGMGISAAEPVDLARFMGSNMDAFLQNGRIDVPTADLNTSANVQGYIQNGLFQGLAVPADTEQGMDIDVDVLPTADTTRTWQENSNGDFEAVQTATDSSVSASPASTSTTAACSSTSTTSTTASEVPSPENTDSDSDSDSDMDMDSPAERTHTQRSTRFRFAPALLPEHMENGVYEHLLQHERDAAATERELDHVMDEANQVVAYVQGELASAQADVAQLKEEQAKLARELRDARETLTRATMDGLRKERDMLDRTLVDLERFQAQARELEEAQERARVLEAEKEGLRVRLGFR